MASASEQKFRESLKKFEARLSIQERQNFRFTTLDDLRQTIIQVQTKQAAKYEAMNLARLRRFLEGFTQMGQVVEVFLNSSQFVAFVWGPMKFLLQVASNYADAFDTLLGAYEKIGECLPLVDQYRTLFVDNNYMEEALAKIYEDVLEFHRRALRFFTLPTWQQFFKSVWKDFDCRFGQILQDIQRHRSLIESQATVLEFQQYQSDRLRLFTSINQIEVAQSKERFTEFRKWAFMADSLQDHKDLSEVREQLPTSGFWLLRNAVYSSWRHDTVPRIPTIWLSGIPGAGKSVLASLVIDDCKKDTSAQTVYFYCKHGDPWRTTCASVLRTLLCQLLKHDHDLMPWIYDEYLVSGQPSLTALDLCKKLLQAVLLSTNRIYLIVDGVDECEQNQAKSLLNIIGEMVSICDNHNPGQFRVMIVSQDELSIRRSLSLFTEIKLRSEDNASDIRAFVALECKQIQQKFELSNEEADYICDLTCNRADGMFLFATLVTSNLYQQPTIEKLQEQIKPSIFPSGLEQAYDRIFTRLNQKPSNERAIAQTVLGWMMCAKRPLRWHEIQCTLSIDMESHTVDFTEKKSRVHIRETCGALVKQLSGDRLELVHSSAKHYLTHNEFVSPSMVEYNLAAICLRYLTLECFEHDTVEKKRKAHLMQGYYTFQDYAACHWSDHLSSFAKNGPGVWTIAPQSTRNWLSTAILDFVAMYKLDDQTSSDEDFPNTKLDHFAGLDFFEDLKHALRHIQEHNSRGAKVLDNINPELLGDTVFANRRMLEDLACSQSLEVAEQQQLRSYYGTKWFKCPKAACFYFHEGFSDQKSKEAHLLRHEKPFRCTIQDCETGYKLGFASKRDLEKHTVVHHPELCLVGPSFRRLRKGPRHDESESPGDRSTRMTKHPASYVCNVCSRSFTRASILKDHQVTHTKEKPYLCRVCNQGFGRDNDRKRHEQGHTGVKKFVCKGKCGVPPRDWGCGREFPRADALANHLRRGAGKECNAPLLEEERLKNQWALQLEEMRAKGGNLLVPQSQLEQQKLITESKAEGTPTPSTDSPFSVSQASHQENGD